MATSNLLERLRKRRNRFFFGNDRRAKITANLIRIAGLAAVLLGVSCCVGIILIGIFVIGVTGPWVAAVTLVGILFMMLSCAMPVIMDNKATRVEKDYKNGKFNELEEDVSEMENQPKSNWVERAKIFIKMMANTVVEHSKKIWEDFHHAFFGDDIKKYRTYHYIAFIGVGIFIAALAIPLALVLTEIIGIALFLSLLVGGILLGSTIATSAVFAIENGRVAVENLRAKMRHDESLTKHVEYKPEFNTAPLFRPKDADSNASASLRFMPPAKELPVQKDANEVKPLSEIDQATLDWMETRGYSQPSV